MQPAHKIRSIHPKYWSRHVQDTGPMRLGKGSDRVANSLVSKISGRGASLRSDWNRFPPRLVFNARSLLEEFAMDRQRVEGGLKKATGTIKEKAGQMTGDRDLEAEGKVDKGEGRVRSAVGKVKDAARDILGKN